MNKGTERTAQTLKWLRAIIFNFPCQRLARSMGGLVIIGAGSKRRNKTGPTSGVLLVWAGGSKEEISAPLLAPRGGWSARGGGPPTRKPRTLRCVTVILIPSSPYLIVNPPCPYTNLTLHRMISRHVSDHKRGQPPCKPGGSSIDR